MPIIDANDRSTASSDNPVKFGFDPVALKRLDAVMQREVDDGNVPGAVILLTQADQIVHQKAYGKQRPDAMTPMSMDSIFRIYSMTKPVISVAIMMLVEQGRLLISQPVAHFLPEFANMQVACEQIAADGSRSMTLEPCARDMTVQDLLRHTAGLTYGFFGGPTRVKAAYRAAGIESGKFSNADLVRHLALLPLAYQPGTVWEYSRATDVLGALLERVCGQPLDVILRGQIFAPLQMVDTGFWVEPSQQHRIAEPFAIDPVTKQTVKVIDICQPPVFLSGGGGLVSTALDYLRFARMLRNGGALDGVRLLSRKMVRFMTSDHLTGMPMATSGPAYLPGAGYGFGLGFAVRTCEGASVTPGSIGDFHWSGLAGTYFWIDPKEDLIGIWLMQAPEQRDKFRQMVRNLVHASLE